MEPLPLPNEPNILVNLTGTPEENLAEYKRLAQFVKDQREPEPAWTTRVLGMFGAMIAVFVLTYASGVAAAIAVLAYQRTIGLFG